MNRREFLTFRPPTVLAAPAHLGIPNANKVTRNASLTPQQVSSRFLAQATLGATLAEINEVTTLGIETWIDQQFTIPQTNTLKYMQDVIFPIYVLEDDSNLGKAPFRWAWWQAIMRGPDLLCQRVAMALSEIMVISTRTDLLDELNSCLATWYDMLLKHAFGNFRDLLFDVTMHPAMGYYLSHASNRKADPATNRFPDENYAREVMQLFSIGLFELNLDGTRKKDSNGKDIPTYDNKDIKEFAKIFTGLTYYILPEWPQEEIDYILSDEGFATFEMGPENCSQPMQMHDKFHEPGEKRLLNGFVVPAGQSGMQDINNTIDNLFNHPNVGPFISRLLIQRLVKSHPSPGYIERVATKFNNNGSGVRGDMKAVVKAILMDDEARNPIYINDPTHGMLREPFVRYTQLCRAMEVRNEAGEDQFYNYGDDAEAQLAQYPFAPPSVFNFFSPDFKPLGPLSNADVNAPEFQIMTSVSAVKHFNFIERAVMIDALMEVPKGTDEPTDTIPVVSDVVLNLAPYQALADNIGALIDRLDLLFTYGSLSNQMRAIITTAVTSLQAQNEDWDETVRFAVVLFLNCPEYAILK